METVSDWRDPFEGDEILCHLATGKEATSEVKSDLLDTRSKALTAMNNFVHDRLEQGGTVNFYNPIHKRSLKTFESMTNKRKKRSNISDLTHNNSRDLFARLFLLGQARNIDNLQLMTYPLGTLPLALSTPEGGLVKTVKSCLLKKLEALAEPPQDVPSNNVAYIHDAMAIIHTLSPSDNMTYSDLSEAVFKIITKNVPRDCRIDLVADTYNDVSIKNPE